MSHHCHAHGCDVAVPPRMLMCKRHWYMVPKLLRDRIWAAYRPGQERDKDPSDAYLIVADQAVCEVARLEGHALETTGYDTILASRIEVDERAFDKILAAAATEDVRTDQVTQSPVGRFDAIFAPGLTVYRRPEKPIAQRFDYRRGGRAELRALAASMREIRAAS